ncbi:MAG: hypothetical protein J0I21_01340 [Alphaproteobacteria bacterium]|nr:hypothetical protein [Alphaproteobacteria bacterium]
MTWLLLAVLGGIGLGGGSAFAQDRQARPPEPAAQDAGSGAANRDSGGAEPLPGDGFGWALQGAPGSPPTLHG